MYKTLSKSRSHLLGGAILVLTTGLMAGCSSDTMRFADAFYQDALSGPQSPAQGNVDERPYDYNAPARNTATASANPQPGTVQQNTYPQQGGYPPAPNVDYSEQQPTQSASVYQPPVRQSVVSGSTYIVESGDTLYDLAGRSGVSVTQLKEANNIYDEMIRTGQKLIIPDGATVSPKERTSAPVQTQVAAAQQAARSVSQAASQQAAQAAQAVQDKANEALAAAENKANATESNVNTQVEKAQTKVQNAVSDAKQGVANATNVAAVAPQTTGITGMRWPARGRVLSNYGEKEGSSTNDGIDISLPEGSIVKAAENGVVIYAGSGLKEFGNTVLVKHDNNVVTVYGHNSSLLVKKGDKVTRGQDIAKSGMSGNASAPKLHFEVRKNSAPVNPANYLEK